MARFSFVTLLAFALVGVAQANPLNLQQSLETPVHTAGGWEYENCGQDSDIIKLKSIKVSPDPPKPGENLTVTVVAEAQEVIEEGAYVDVTVKLGLIKLLHKQFDVCEEARNSDVDLECPVEKGDYEVTQTVALPKEIPPAKFVVEVKGYSVDERDMACVNLKVDFMNRLSPLGKLSW